MNELTSEILSNWILSGYQYIHCTVTLDRINLHPVFHKAKIEYENTYLLPINDEVITQAAKGRTILGYKFVYDISDIERS